MIKLATAVFSIFLLHSGSANIQLNGGGYLTPDRSSPIEAQEECIDMRIGLSVHWGKVKVIERVFLQTKNVERFNIEKDLILANFDCKTDVDDLHSVAAFTTLLSNHRFSKVKYHAVAGAYGIQEGLYVPANSLFQLAFNDNWTDAHKNLEVAVEKVKSILIKTLKSGGDIWIAEAGQSDFSAALIKAIRIELPEINTSQRIHVIQHSDWNEEVTSPEKLNFVKQKSDYHKIPDGNAIGNGSPGFRSPDYKDWKSKVTNPRLRKIWQLAIDLGVKYNGQEGRYNNEAISAGGLDFSDLSETCWILGLEDIRDVNQFFNNYAN